MLLAGIVASILVMGWALARSVGERSHGPDAQGHAPSAGGPAVTVQLVRPDGSTRRIAVSPPVDDIEFSPDGTKALILVEDPEAGGVYGAYRVDLVHLGKGSRVRLVHEPEAWAYIGWLPDGRFLLIGSRMLIGNGDTGGDHRGRRVPVTAGPSVPVRRPAGSPRGGQGRLLPGRAGPRWPRRADDFRTLRPRRRRWTRPLLLGARWTGDRDRTLHVAGDGIRSAAPGRSHVRTQGGGRRAGHPSRLRS